MSLQEAIKVVEQLSPEELRQLRAYLDEREANTHIELDLSPAERARRLNEAFDQLREGLTEEELEEMSAAMNEEYIEPWDENEWSE
jgi:hypothetical protein